MKSLFGGSAALAATLLAGYSLFINTQPLFAETISLQQKSTQQDKHKVTKTEEKTAQTDQTTQPASTTEKSSTETTSTIETDEPAVAPPESYTATAYAFRGRTASGRLVGKGVIAADTRVLPMGTRVRLEAGTWSGVYTVSDTGGAIRGRKIDVWVPSTGEACRFGRRKVKLTVLSYGGRRGARTIAKK